MKANKALAASRKVSQISYLGFCKCHWLVTRQIYPGCQKVTLVCLGFCRQTLLPPLHRGALRVKQEALSIHHNQNWFKRFTGTMLDNSLGLVMAMLSARIVQNLVETRELSNLWGLLATRPVVSEQTYEVLSFMVEFVIALLVFTLTEHYLAEFRKSRQKEAS